MHVNSQVKYISIVRYIRKSTHNSMHHIEEVNLRGIDLSVVVWSLSGQIRDFKSEIRKTAGAPDPTFGLVDGTPGHWVQALDELRGSFDSVCTTKYVAFVNFVSFT